MRYICVKPCCGRKSLRYEVGNGASLGLVATPSACIINVFSLFSTNLFVCGSIFSLLVVLFLWLYELEWGSICVFPLISAWVSTSMFSSFCGWVYARNVITVIEFLADCLFAWAYFVLIIHILYCCNHAIGWSILKYSQCRVALANLYSICNCRWDFLRQWNYSIRNSLICSVALSKWAWWGRKLICGSRVFTMLSKLYFTCCSVVCVCACVYLCAWICVCGCVRFYICRRSSVLTFSAWRWSLTAVYCGDECWIWVGSVVIWLGYVFLSNMSNCRDCWVGSVVI